MPNLWEVIVFAGLGLLWLLFAIWPQPLWFLWQSVSQPDASQPGPISSRAHQVLRRLALLVTLVCWAVAMSSL